MEIDIKTIVAMVCVSAVSILVGYILMTQMELSAMPSISTSVLSTSGNTILGGFGQASTMLAVGLFVLALVLIIGILASILGRGE